MDLYQIQRVLFSLSQASIVDDQLQLRIPFDDLKLAILNSGILKAAFQEDWYKSIYPDVVALIDSGAVPSALEHFVSEGFWSGRLGHAIEVDEIWYRERYPDVDQALTDGVISSCTDHFQKHGFVEGRAPSHMMSVDAKWYSRQYMMAARQVALGKYPSLQHYFNAEGIGLGHFANEEAVFALLRKGVA
jgi:hypothetical protein